MSVVQMAVPLFFGLILLEVATGLFTRRRYYRLNDTIADLSTSAIFSVSGVVITVAWVAVYDAVQSAWSAPALLALPALPSGAPLIVEGGTFAVDPAALAAWAMVLVAVDFLYYWFHRATHQVNFLWACHVTHHSSEEFNLSVALRQCAFQRVFEYLFMLPLAFAGVPWFMMLICHEIMKLYQFWVHTRYFKSLGFMEKFLLTPSHHRVHHGRDPEYIDKNHGGILILWDKWFGTFAREKAEPHYGLTKPLARFNPLWSNVHHYAYLWETFWRIESWRDRLLLLVMPPGWKPDAMRAAGEPREVQPVPADYRPYDPPLSRGLTLYAFAQFASMMIVTLIFLRLARVAAAPHLLLFCFGALAVLGLGSIGSVLDRHRLAVRFETIRLAGAVCVLSLSVTLAGGLPAYPGFILAAFCLGSLAWLFALRGQLRDSSPPMPAPNTV